MLFRGIENVGKGRLQSLAKVTAVILAGGFGTRLRSLVTDRPKVLAGIRGRPCLAYLLDQLHAAGTRTVVLCTGYLGEHVHATFGSSYRGMCLLYSQEPAPIGTAGAVRLALPLFKSRTVLVMNGDSYCDADLRAFWHSHGQQRSEGSLLLAEVEDTSRYGRVRLDGEGIVTGFDEKSDLRKPGWINAGVYLLEQALVETIPVAGAVSIEKDMFPCWAGAGKLRGYCCQGRFLDIGTPESYALAEDFFARITH